MVADGVGASRGGWPCPPTLQRSHSGVREYDTYTQRQERQKEGASGAPPFCIPLPLRPSCAPVPSLIPKDISSLPELASFCLSSCLFPSFTRKEEKRQEWLALFHPSLQLHIKQGLDHGYPAPNPLLGVQSSVLDLWFSAFPNRLSS